MESNVVLEMLLEHTILCKSLKAPIISLYFPSKELDFLIGLEQSWAIVLQAFWRSFTFILWTNFQFLDLTMLFKKNHLPLIYESLSIEMATNSWAKPVLCLHIANTLAQNQF